MSVQDLKEAATVLMRDDQGVILFEATTPEKGSFTKTFDLKELPMGTYYVSVRTSLSERVQPVEKTRLGIEVNTSRSREFFTPTIKAGRGHVDVSLFNGKVADVGISIFDNDNHLLLREELENVVLVEKRFSTEKLPFGRYYIVVEAPNKTYTKAFDVR